MKVLLAFQNVMLIDGTGREPLPRATVAVRDGKIIYAGKAKTWQPSADEDTINLDYAGKYLLPGLIDAHVHLSRSGEPDGQAKTDDGSMALKILTNARKSLAAGITTVRDLGGWNGLEFSVRRATQRGEFSGPRMMLAGRFILAAEASADHYEGMYRIASGVNEVREVVREQIKSGADLIKLDVTHFNAEEIQAAVEEAKKFGNRVAVCAHNIDEIRKAVQAGVHTVEHGTFLFRGTDVIEEMKRRGTFLIPTLQSSGGIVNGGRSNVPKKIVEKEMQDAAKRSLHLAYEAGVQIAMGSGAAASINHGENSLEVYRMFEAGMKPMDALVASTSMAAKALGWDAWLGSVEDGKAADLLIVDENPLDDLKRLADKKLLRAVFLDGKLVARQLIDSYPKTILARDCLQVG